MTEEEARSLEFTVSTRGSRMKLRVKPGSNKAALLGTHAGALKLGVTAAPERGKANAAVVKLLSKVLGISRDLLSITSGEASRNKVVAVDGLSPDEIRRRLTNI